MTAKALATCDWDEMHEKTSAALTKFIGGPPGLALFEQMAWKSHDSRRCAECGAHGEVKHERPMLAQAVPHYWLCRDCWTYYEESVGCELVVEGLA